MATKEVDGLLQVKDAAGDVNVIYPVTKAKNVEGLLDESGKIPSSQLPDMDYLPLSGGTMTGDLILSEGNYIYFGDTSNCGIAESSGDLELGAAGSIVLTSDTRVIDAGLSQIQNVETPSFNKDAANKSYVDSRAPKSTTITLTASGWTGTSAPYTQTVTVSGVSANETQQSIQPTPKLSSQAAYMEAGVYASGQAANSLTFSCSKKPTVDLTVYVVIQGVA